MTEAHMRICNLTLGYGNQIIQRNLTFDIRRGDIFIIMGGSGCGKSTLLKHLIGLKRPKSGDIFYHDKNLWRVSEKERQTMMQHFGVTYQSGALISSMTLGENVAMPMELYTPLKPSDIRELVGLKLALVGLTGFEDYFPAELSGGMLKRAALARAMALDPDILFFDEPSAGLDPIRAKLLDDLILRLRDSLGTTVVIVTHELASIFAIGNNSVFLDADSKTSLANGHPLELLEHCPLPQVQRFLRRGDWLESA